MQPGATSLEGFLKSDRVVYLTAACIRAAIRLKFHYEISFSESLEMARVHDLKSALSHFAAKMELHRNLPPESRVKLSVVESALEPAVSSGLSSNSDGIVKLRIKTVDAISAQVNSLEDRSALLTKLRNLRTESKLWAEDYARFLASLGTLYRQTRTTLVEMGLADSDKHTALAALETIATNAIRQAGEI